MFPASFLLSSYTTEKNMAVMFICLIPIFVLHEKKISFQSLILAKRSLPVFRHIKTLKEYKNYVGQQQHLEDGNQRKTLSIKQKHLWKCCTVLKFQPFVRVTSSFVPKNNKDVSQDVLEGLAVKRRSLTCTNRVILPNRQTENQDRAWPRIQVRN